FLGCLHEPRPLGSGLPLPNGRGSSELLLQLHRQLIDLRRQDEVILGQAADSVRPDFDRDIAIAYQMQIWMMVFRLRNVADALEEIKGGQEVLDTPLATNALAVARQPPIWDRRQV